MTVNDNIIDYGSAPVAHDRFSWNRVLQLYAYYSPVVKKQCALYFAFSALCATLLLLPLNEVLQMGFYTVVWTAIPLMYLMSPCAFGKNDASPIAERLLPVKTAEKIAFFFTYLFIALPAALYALPCAAMWIYLHTPALQTEEMMHVYEIQINNPLTMRGLNLITTISGLLTCLCVVETAQNNKIFKGIISVIAVNFVEGLLGAVYGLSNILEEGFGTGNTGMSMGNPDDVTKRILDNFANASGYQFFMYALFIAYSAVLIWLLHRTFRHKNM